MARTPVPSIGTDMLVPASARATPTVAAPAAPQAAPRANVREGGYTTAATSPFWATAAEEVSPDLQWPESVRTFDRMRRTDAQVTSVLRAVALPVRRTRWQLDPAGADERVVRLVAEDLGLPVRGAGEQAGLPARGRGRFSWAEHLAEVLEMLTYGHSYFEQVYRLDDAGYARLRKLAARPASTLSRINVAEDGGLVSVEQQRILGDRTDRAPIPVNRLVAYVHDGTAGNWQGRSLLRPAYKHWLLKDRLLRVQAETIERNGMGVPIYEGAEGEKSLALGLQLAQSYRAGASGGGAVPYGARLRLSGVEGELPDAERAIRYHDEQIGRAVLAHFLNLGTQTGSWALGTTFADFFTLSLQTVGELIADVATHHVVEDLVDVNFGSDEPAPRVVFEEIGSRQVATAQAVKLLVDAGVLRPDEALEQAMRSTLGLPEPGAAAVPALPPTGSE